MLRGRRQLSPYRVPVPPGAADHPRSPRLRSRASGDGDAFTLQTTAFACARAASSWERFVPRSASTCCSHSTPGCRACAPLHANSAREALVKMSALPLLAGRTSRLPSCIDAQGVRRVNEIVWAPGRVENEARRVDSRTHPGPSYIAAIVLTWKTPDREPATTAARMRRTRELAQWSPRALHGGVARRRRSRHSSSAPGDRWSRWCPNRARS